MQLETIGDAATTATATPSPQYNTGSDNLSDSEKLQLGISVDPVKTDEITETATMNIREIDPVTNQSYENIFIKGPKEVRDPLFEERIRIFDKFSKDRSKPLTSDRIKQSIEDRRSGVDIDITDESNPFYDMSVKDIKDLYKKYSGDWLTKVQTIQRNAQAALTYDPATYRP